MAQKITRGVEELLAEANARIPTIPVDEALALVDSDDHVLVDLRKSGEGGFGAWVKAGGPVEQLY